MKCLLIYPPVSEKWSLGHGTFPLGLGYIAAALDRAGIEVQVLDIWIKKMSRDSVCQTLNEVLPSCNWVGISGIINGFKYIAWLVSQIKSIDRQIPVVLGGSICSPNPKLLLQSTEADICCIGEGDETVVEIATLLAGEKSPDDVMGIAYNKDGRIVITPNRPFQQDTSRFDYPKWDLFHIKEYVSRPIVVPGKEYSMNLIGSRGCPYHCKFCSPCLGRTVRLRHVNSVLSEINILIERYGVRHFEFSDELFLLKEGMIRQFCKKLIQGNYGLTWRALGRVDVLHRFSDDTLKLLKKSGCHWIGFGMESGSQKILHLMNKGIKVEQSESAIKRLRNLGIKVSGTFIIGFPGETKATIRDTVRFCKKNLLPVYALTICCPLPGTKLYVECLRNGLVTNEVAFWERLDAPLTELIVNLTDFSDEELLRLKNDAEDEINTWTAKHGRRTAWE